MYDSAEGKRFIIVIPKKKVLLNKSHIGLWYHGMEDRDLVIVNTAEENREIFPRRDLSGARE